MNGKSVDRMGGLRTYGQSSAATKEGKETSRAGRSLAPNDVYEVLPLAQFASAEDKRLGRLLKP